MRRGSTNARKPASAVAKSVDESRLNSGAINNRRSLKGVEGPDSGEARGLPDQRIGQRHRVGNPHDVERRPAIGEKLARLDFRRPRRRVARAEGRREFHRPDLHGQIDRALSEATDQRGLRHRQAVDHLGSRHRCGLTKQADAKASQPMKPMIRIASRDAEPLDATRRFESVVWPSPWLSTLDCRPSHATIPLRSGHSRLPSALSLPCGVMVTQRSLEPFFMVRIHAGQPETTE